MLAFLIVPHQLLFSLQRTSAPRDWELLPPPPPSHRTSPEVPPGHSCEPKPFPVAPAAVSCLHSLPADTSAFTGTSVQVGERQGRGCCLWLSSRVGPDSRLLSAGERGQGQRPYPELFYGNQVLALAQWGRGAATVCNRAVLWQLVAVLSRARKQMLVHSIGSKEWGLGTFGPTSPSICFAASFHVSSMQVPNTQLESQFHNASGGSSYRPNTPSLHTYRYRSIWGGGGLVV